jgi:hypothetical protein
MNGSPTKLKPQSRSIKETAVTGRPSIHVAEVAMSQRIPSSLPVSVSIEITRKIYQGFYYVERGAVMVA